jgi:hypothetical protein
VRLAASGETEGEEVFAALDEASFAQGWELFLEFGWQLRAVEGGERLSAGRSESLR